MSDKWFIKRKEKLIGPFDQARLVTLAETGQLKPNDSVSRDQTTWEIASRIPGLAFSAMPASVEKPRLDQLDPIKVQGPNQTRLAIPSGRSVNAPATSSPTTQIDRGEACDEWFVFNDDEELGPYSREQIKELITTNQITQETLLRRASDDRFEQAIFCRAFFDADSARRFFAAREPKGSERVLLSFRRALAWIIDSFILALPMIVIPILLVLAFGQETIEAGEVPQAIAIALSIGFGILQLISVVYFVIKDAKWSGRSIGKLIMGTQTVDRDTGRPISFGQAFHRNLIIWMPQVVAGIAVGSFVVSYGNRPISPDEGIIGLLFVIALLIASLLPEFFVIAQIVCGRSLRYGDGMANTRVISLPRRRQYSRKKQSVTGGVEPESKTRLRNSGVPASNQITPRFLPVISFQWVPKGWVIRALVIGIVAPLALIMAFGNWDSKESLGPLGSPATFGASDASNFLAFAANGKEIIEKGQLQDGQNIIVRDILTGVVRHTFAAKLTSQPQFANVGGTVCLAAGTLLTILDLTSGETSEFPNPGFAKYDLSANGKYLATCEEAHIKVWEISARRTCATIPISQQSTNVMKLSPDGDLLAAQTQPGEIKIWRVADGVLLSTIKPELGGYSDQNFDFPNSNLIVTRGYREICLWQPATGKQTSRVETTARKSMLSHNGKVLVTLSYDEFKCWSVNSARLLSTIKPKGFSDSESVVLLNDNRTAVVCTRSELQLWDIYDGIQVASQLHDPVKSLSLRANGGKLLLMNGNGSVETWNVAGRGSWFLGLLRRFCGATLGIIAIGFGYVWFIAPRLSSPGIDAEKSPRKFEAGKARIAGGMEQAKRLSQSALISTADQSRRFGRFAWPRLVHAFRQSTSFFATAGRFFVHNRSAIARRVAEVIPSMKSKVQQDREIHIDPAITHSRATFVDSVWQVTLPQCCVICGSSSDCHRQDETTVMFDFTRPLFLLVGSVAIGLILALWFWRLWLFPVVTIVGLMASYAARRELSVKYELSRCNEHLSASHLPNAQAINDILIINVGCKATKVKFVTEDQSNIINS